MAWALKYWIFLAVWSLAVDFFAVPVNQTFWCALGLNHIDKIGVLHVQLHLPDGMVSAGAVVQSLDTVRFGYLGGAPSGRCHILRQLHAVRA